MFTWAWENMWYAYLIGSAIFLVLGAIFSRMDKVGNNSEKEE